MNLVEALLHSPHLLALRVEATVDHLALDAEVPVRVALEVLRRVVLVDRWTEVEA